MAGKAQGEISEDTAGKLVGSLEKPAASDLADVADASDYASAGSSGGRYYGGGGSGHARDGDGGNDASGDTDTGDTDAGDTDDEGDDTLLAESDDDQDEADTDTDDDSSDGDSGDGSDSDGESGDGDGREFHVPDNRIDDDDDDHGGRVSIDIQAMTTLIAAMERARDQLPEFQGEFRTILTDAGLAGADVPGLRRIDDVVAWIEDELPGLRRRLALAQELEGDGRRFRVPEVPVERDRYQVPQPPRTPVAYREDMVPAHPPHTSREQARVCASLLATEPAESAEVRRLLDTLRGNQHDPYFAHAFTAQADPSAVVSALAAARTDHPASAAELDTLVSATVRTAARGTGDLAPGDDFDTRWAGFAGAPAPTS